MSESRAKATNKEFAVTKMKVRTSISAAARRASAQLHGQSHLIHLRAASSAAAAGAFTANVNAYPLPAVSAKSNKSYTAVGEQHSSGYAGTKEWNPVPISANLERIFYPEPGLQIK